MKCCRNLKSPLNHWSWRQVSLCSSLFLPESGVLMTFNFIWLRLFLPACLNLSYLGQQTCPPSGPASPWTLRLLCVQPSAFSLPVFILFIIMFSSISVFLAETIKKNQFNIFWSSGIRLYLNFFPNVRTYREKNIKDFNNFKSQVQCIVQQLQVFGMLQKKWS